MENNLGKAIYCNCYLTRYNRYKVLGSITDQGMLEVLRPHENKTIIETQEFFIKCRDCGFTKYIQIKSMELKHPTDYEKQN